MNLDERIAMHRRMAEGFGNSYRTRRSHASADQCTSWYFVEDAEYFAPYFTGGRLIYLRDYTAYRSLDISIVAATEEQAYSAQFPDWGPIEFKYWPSDNGFVMKTLFQGHTRQGRAMSFWAGGFIETNAEGLITRWETHVNGEEIGPFLDIAIGVRGPFSSPSAYFRALIATGQEPQI